MMKKIVNEEFEEIDEEAESGQITERIQRK